MVQIQGQTFTSSNSKEIFSASLSHCCFSLFLLCACWVSFSLLCVCLSFSPFLLTSFSKLVWFCSQKQFSTIWHAIISPFVSPKCKTKQDKTTLHVLGRNLMFIQAISWSNLHFAAGLFTSEICKIHFPFFISSLCLFYYLHEVHSLGFKHIECHYK